jgi:hypothetical protein
VVLCAAVVILAGVEVAVSSLIADKLQKTIAAKLDAQLRIGTLWYVPPLGARVTGAALVRDGADVVQLGKATLQLARLPIGRGPVVIESIRLDAPVIHISPAVLAGGLIKNARWKPDRKLSEMLRLRKLRLEGGRVEYDAPGEGPPTVWSNIDIDIDTAQTSPSEYRYALAAQAGSTSQLTAGGAIDVDSLHLNLKNVAMRVRAEPNPSTSPLPAQVQTFLKQYDISGSLEITGAADLPLRELNDASGSMTVQLDRASARIPKGNIRVDHASLQATLTRAPCLPIFVTFDEVSAAGGGKHLDIQPGARAKLDPSDLTWKIWNVNGRAHIDPPGDHPAPPANKFEAHRWAGTADFTASASGPLHFTGHWWDAIDHEVIAYARGAGFQPRRFPLRVENIVGGPIRLANGVITFNNLSAAYGTDEIRVRTMRLPVEGLPKLSHYKEIAATVVFHHPGPQHTPKLQKVLNFLGPDGPFDIAGNYTIDKRRGDDPPQLKLSYDLLISSDHGTFNLTPRRIAFANMKGDGRATERGVTIEHAQADVLGGKAVVSGQFIKKDPPHGVPSTYAGSVNLQGIDLAAFQQAWSVKGKSAKHLGGRVFADAAISGTARRGAALKSLKADGTFEVAQADFFELPIVHGVLAQMKLPTDSVTASDAAADFSIDRGVLHLDNAVISSPLLGLEGGGDAALDGSKLDLRVVAAPLADWRDGLKRLHVPLVSDVGSEVAGGIQDVLNAATGTLLYEFRIGGTAASPTFNTVPAPVLSDSGAALFGEMLGGKKVYHREEYVGQTGGQPVKALILRPSK